ncbi:MAG: ligase-associated DNA damage response endonuclease PdeM [Hydrogenophaga sp.]|uniref:ligase-associated DNA damage response endonuclease PdeM n=1 Tax=Hydrogenophaga sp. TaxID=1904254 RepID=UPI00263312A1|nr:ligase-associated DNA damage response endonuclease PdeM [Hydrogenophaga sp.]MDM7944010.1 ligase-associated DNA damage response endonuclease PdeM [Hydrogenophaga sp.]
MPVHPGAGLTICLHPSGAAFLPDHGALLVADVHLGKAASFRRLGVPVPGGSTAATLDALSDALASLGDTPVKHLVFLGDLLHAARGRSPELTDVVAQALAAWRGEAPGLRVHLVRGNHDRDAGDPPVEWGIELRTEPWLEGPWALCHEPQPVAGAYTLAGHLHPCIGLRGGARERLRLPCFWFGDPARHAVGVLPAFGDFTGMHPIQRRPGDRVWAVADESVREVPVARR